MLSPIRSRAAGANAWQRRGAVQEPDILLLDEPTNHLDLEGIKCARIGSAIRLFRLRRADHDRYFLENTANAMVELSRSYEDGFLRVAGNYSKFLEAKENLSSRTTKASGRARKSCTTNLEWLRRGPKARHQSQGAYRQSRELIGELADMNSRTRTTLANINFSASNRQTRQLIHLDDVGFVRWTIPFEKVQFGVTSGMRVGLVGPNGSGKSTLLLLWRTPACNGKIRRADNLRVVYFDQNRRLNPDVLLGARSRGQRFGHLPGTRDSTSSHGARFLFTGEDLNRPVGRFSGGERARVPDRAIDASAGRRASLDEPTNDLDIPTLEILEESLLEFSGALVLVTHDRFLLDRVSNIVFGLDGFGGAERFADYFQWEEWKRQNERLQARGLAPGGTNGSAPAREENTSAASPSQAASRKKLTYKEAREFELMEKTIHDRTATPKLLDPHTRPIVPKETHALASN